MDKILVKFFNFLIVIIAAFPLIGMRRVIYIIVLWILIAITLAIRKKAYLSFFKNWKSLLILISYYIINIISFLILGENTLIAIKRLETQALFFLFPFFIYLNANYLLKKTIQQSLISFAIANIILCLYVLLKMMNIGFVTLLNSDTYYNPIIRETFSNLTQIHLPYLGLLFSFSAIIIIDLLIKQKISYKILKFIAILSVIILLFSILIFSARMAFLAFCIAITYYFFKNTSKKNFIIFFISLLTISYLATFLNPVERRIKEFTNSNFILPKENTESNKVNFRVIIYGCSFEVLKEKWLIGAGLGNTQKALDRCYANINYTNYDDFKKIQYNTHNQYLNEFITNGIIGFLLFIGFLIYLYRKSKGVYRIFLIIITISLVTENIFSREIGVIFFTLFNTLYYFSNWNSKNAV